MPMRRPQQLETVEQRSLYPAVPVMRGGSYAAGQSPRHSPRHSPMRPRPAATASQAYSPAAPKSGSVGSMGVTSPHVHWADFAFVREVSTIFDRQMALEMMPHTPEVVENPFRRRTARQFVLDDATPPALSASAGTLFSAVPMPTAAQAHAHANAAHANAAHANMFGMGNMFAGMGTPVTERPVSSAAPAYGSSHGSSHGTPHGHAMQMHHAKPQPQHLSASSSAGAHGAHYSSASPLHRVQMQHNNSGRIGGSSTSSARPAAPKSSGHVQTVTTVQAYTPNGGAHPTAQRRNSASSYAYAPGPPAYTGRTSSGW